MYLGGFTKIILICSALNWIIYGWDFRKRNLNELSQELDPLSRCTDSKMEFQFSTKQIQCTPSPPKIGILAKVHTQVWSKLMRNGNYWFVMLKMFWSKCIVLKGFLHSSFIPTSRHRFRRQDWHLRRIHISISQLPPYLHLYVDPRVILLLKNPKRTIQKKVPKSGYNASTDTKNSSK